MKDALTVCLTNWRRPDHLRATVASLKRQSIRTVLFLWNNGPPIEQNDFDWVLDSSVNQACWPRWLMASFAESDYVCSIDDDLMLRDNSVLLDIMERVKGLPERCIFGPEGVNLIEGKTYKEAEHYVIEPTKREHDGACDIIKGKFMMMKTSALRSSVTLADPDACREDDIAISGLVAAGRRKQHLCLQSFAHRFENPALPHALWQREGHFERRDAAVARFFPSASPTAHDQIGI